MDPRPEEASLLLDRPSLLQHQSTSQGNMGDSEPPHILCETCACIIHTSLQSCIITPRAHARARGYVIGRGGVHKSTVFLEPIFYLSKYSLSELYFNTDRLLIEFNGLWYSLAARQVFVAIANPDSLSFG